MAAGFLDSIKPDLETVHQKVNRVLKIKAGHLSKFAHVEYTSLEKELRPALVLHMARLFGCKGEQVNSLAAVIQFIYMAATVHFGIPDTEQNFKDNTCDPREGSQIPVLVGDYLYGKFFTTLCDAGLHDFLDPLARIIAEINIGAMKRKQSPGLNVGDGQYIEIVSMETASLFAGACRLSALLAGADEKAVELACSFGRNLGLAFGLLERGHDPAFAAPYLDKSAETLKELPGGPPREELALLVEELRNHPDLVPGRRLGREISATLDTPKEKMVRRFFNSIAPNYDVTNTIISFGRHHYWRRFTVEKTRLAEGGSALDVCCGTGMVTMDLARRAGPTGRVVGIDFSENMLAVARENMKNFSLKDIVELVQGNAMDLPFPDNSFDCATIVYGLRNVPDIKRVLLEMKRVVKPGGKVVSLEFAKPYVPVFKQIYGAFIDKWLPLMGKLNTKNRDAYKYLHDSIVAYPHQHEVTRIYRELGFAAPECFELSWGIVACHVGIKPRTGL